MGIDTSAFRKLKQNRGVHQCVQAKCGRLDCNDARQWMFRIILFSDQQNEQGKMHLMLGPKAISTQAVRQNVGPQDLQCGVKHFEC